MKFSNIFTYLCLFIFIFSFNYLLPTDPDLGWHLRYGQELIEKGRIFSNDTLTHTVSGTKIPDYEWLFNGVLFFAFSHWSFLGVALIFAFLTSFAFFLPALSFQGPFWLKFLLVGWSLLGTSFIATAGARPQNVGWVFCGLLLILLLKYRESQKIRYLLFLPLLFLFWINSHPSFWLGVMVILLFAGTEIFFAFVQGKMNSVKYILPFTLFLLLALVVGYKFHPDLSGTVDFFKGLFLPLDLAMQSSQVATVRVSIGEWRTPDFLDFDGGSLFFLGIIFSVATFSIKKKLSVNDYKNLILLAFFIYFSTLSLRNLPFFFLAFIPLTMVNLNDLCARSRVRYLTSYLNLVAILIMLIVSGVKIFTVTQKILSANRSLSSYCQLASCPSGAVEFIKREKPKDRMFNYYDWGGFLSWELRDYPVFIDGRMPGTSLYSEFEVVWRLKPGWEKIMDKYQVGWMLVPNEPGFKEAVLKNDLWQEIYSDDMAMVLAKK